MRGAPARHPLRRADPTARETPNRSDPCAQHTKQSLARPFFLEGQKPQLASVGCKIAVARRCASLAFLAHAFHQATRRIVDTRRDICAPPPRPFGYATEILQPVRGALELPSCTPTQRAQPPHRATANFAAITNRRQMVQPVPTRYLAKPQPALKRLPAIIPKSTYKTSSTCQDTVPTSFSSRLARLLIRRVYNLSISSSAFASQSSCGKRSSRSFLFSLVAQLMS